MNQAQDLTFGVRMTFNGREAVIGMQSVLTGFKQLGEDAQAAGRSVRDGLGNAGSGGQPLEQVRNQLDKTALSSKQLASAMRGVPAQFTDIVTSLSSGQSPFTVLIQQGGQLKDMFGGVGPAFKAIGGYAASLVSPFSLATGAVAAFSLAAYRGAEESRALNQQLLLSGAAANSSLNELKNISAGVAQATGATKGAAAAAVGEMVSFGYISAEMMGKVGEASLNLQRAAGVAVEETVKQFAELGKSPVDASTKLNEKTGFLTAALYAQIKALEDQGKTAEAAARAQEAYADHLNSAAAKIQEDIGTLEKAWKGIGDVAKKAWDAMLDVGREGSLQEQLKKAQADLAGGGWVLGGKSALENRIAVLQAQIDAQNKANVATKEANELNKAQVTWLADGDKYLTKQQQMLREIARVKAMGAAAQAPQGEIDQRVAAVRDKYKETEKASDYDRLIAAIREKTAVAALDAQTEARLTDSQKLAAKTMADLRDSKIKLTETQKISIRGALEEAIATEQLARAKEAEQKADAMRGQYRLEDRTAIERLQREGELAQMTERQRTVTQALNQVEDVAVQRKAKINELFANETAVREKLIQDIDEMTAARKRETEDLVSSNYDATRTFETGWRRAYQKYQDEASNAAKTAETVFSSSVDAMSDAAAKWATGQKVNFDSVATSFVQMIIKMQMQAAAAQATAGFSQFFAGLFGGSSSSGSGGAGGSVDAGSLQLGEGQYYAAKGAWFDGSVAAFAKGGAFTNSIVSSPTMFRFANGGKFGLMGEAGPEAIMPLTRDSSGRLGVSVSGGSSSGGDVIVNVIESEGNGGKVEQRSGSNGDRVIDVFVEKVKASVAGDIAQGGVVSDAMVSTFGLNRAAGAWR